MRTQEGVFQMKGIKILGTGRYAPDNLATNEDFAKIVETSDEWITTRTGMKVRHISDGEPTWMMASKAAKNALQHAGISAERSNNRGKLDFKPEDGWHCSTKMWYCRLYHILMLQHLNIRTASGVVAIVFSL